MRFMFHSSQCVVALLILFEIYEVSGWATVRRGSLQRQSTKLDMAAVGIFYGTSTGTTEECAMKIYQAFGTHIAAEPVDIDNVDEVGEEFRKHQALVVGVPTWKTDAATERSGTGWDQLYYQKLPWLASSLQGKKVAVFGLGDQAKYPGNFADAAGELFDTFAGLGCIMYGSWEETGYMHYASKSVREFGGYKKFCGLILDVDNQNDLTDSRVQQWVGQLAAEGFFEPRPPPGAATPPPVAQEAPALSPEVIVEEDEEVRLSDDQFNEDLITSLEEAPLPKTAADIATSSFTEPDKHLQSEDGSEDGEEVDILNKAILDAEARLRELEREQAELREFLRRREEAELYGSNSNEVPGPFTAHYNEVTGKTMWTSADGRLSFLTAEPSVTDAS